MLRKVALAATALAAGCSAPISETPRYSLDACTRVGLVDVDNGELVTGAEDMAFDARSQRLFISAYDRRKVEKAAAKGAFAVPQGGLYAVTLDELLAADGRLVEVSSLVRREDVPGGLRPHGLDFDSVANEVVFVNRSYQRINDKWRMNPSVRRVGAAGEPFVGDGGRAPCTANDLVATGAAALVSFDHAACGASKTIEAAFALKRSGLADERGEKLFSGAAYANGLAVTANGDIALAATRENTVYALRDKGGVFGIEAAVKTPGGPDNLTLGADGRIVAAVHPSLMRLALNRRLGLGSAPSRVVSIEPDTADVAVLFDDAKGAVFSAATVAVETPRALVLGSATDAGLLVCRNRAPGAG